MLKFFRMLRDFFTSQKMIPHTVRACPKIRSLLRMELLEMIGSLDDEEVFAIQNGSAVRKIVEQETVLAALNAGFGPVRDMLCERFDYITQKKGYVVQIWNYVDNNVHPVFYYEITAKPDDDYVEFKKPQEAEAATVEAIAEIPEQPKVMAAAGGR